MKKNLLLKNSLILKKLSVCAGAGGAATILRDIDISFDTRPGIGG